LTSMQWMDANLQDSVIVTSLILKCHANVQATIITV